MRRDVITIQMGNMVKKTQLILLVVILCACSKEQAYMPQILDNQEYFCAKNKVTISDVNTVVSTEDTKGSMAKKITPFVDREQDTLLYIVEFEKGWRMYSSDKRTPAVLAESDEGSFEIESKNESSLVWLACIAEDIKKIKQSDDSKLNFTAEEISQNIAFWESRCNSDAFVEKWLKTKVAPDLPIGQYELVSINDTVEVFDSIPHLTVTQWHQNEPFNNYCPLKAGSTSDRVPAGCVAIAGAQMLYFLHYKFGVPQMAPSSAICIGDEYNHFMSQSDMSSSIWDIMPTTVATYNANAAPLVAMVGILINMDYSSDGSAASTSDLKDLFFSELGISSIYSTYSENQLKASLLNGEPVIVRADGSVRYILGIPIYEDGHSFIIDGYLRKRVVTTATYRWVANGPSTSPLPIIQPEDRITITYGSPVIHQIRMNWGWESQWFGNDAWYTLTGDWLVDYIAPETYNFAINRGILYGFEAMY